MGEGPRVVRNLELGAAGHGELTLAFLGKLAQALDVDIPSLLAADQAGGPVNDREDAARALNVVFEPATIPLTNTADIAETLAWSLARTENALRDAGALLAEAGLRLHSLPRIGVTVRTAAGGLTDDELGRLGRAKATRGRGVKTTHARLLARMIAGEFASNWRQNATENVRMTIDGLRKQGLIHDVPGRAPTLSEGAAFSLLLTDEAPAA